MRIRLDLIACFLLVAAFFVGCETSTTKELAATPQPPPFEPSQFMRFVDLGDRSGHLDTATVSYENADGTQVHLAGAVHIADPVYYALLRADFATYDTLLYEMVKPKNAPAPGPEYQSASPVSFVQKSMTRILALQFQLEGINYQADNFVHADLDAESFSRLQREKGESLWSLMMTNMRSQMQRRREAAAAGKPTRELTAGELLSALMSKDGARDLKYLLAQQFEDMEAQIAGAMGDDNVILIERNKACIEVLQRELAAGKKNIGVFYGAAHMRDLEERLVKEMGFHRTEHKWNKAWSIGNVPPESTER